MHVRHERLMQRHLKLASFRETKTLDDFDWRFNPSIKRKPICDLATKMDELPDCAEKSAGLRKLLEAKDCFVRAAFPA